MLVTLGMLTSKSVIFVSDSVFLHEDIGMKSGINAYLECEKKITSNGQKIQNEINRLFKQCITVAIECFRLRVK